ncbi:MAG: NAD(P)-dependent oxidoreductase [Planctomycetes bacterium]|nr:NAD(P)-dependent oxidoreductase [Planctomycetota bacterium]
MSLGDADAIESVVAEADAVIHLATCKEDRDGVIEVSFRGTFNLLEAAARSDRLRRFLLASGDCVNGIYFNRQPVPIDEDIPMAAYPGYYPLSKVIEETMARQYFVQQGVPTVTLRMSWIHTEDDILNHLTVAGEQFGVPVWSELMNDDQKARMEAGQDAAVALRHPDGKPMRRHIVAVEDCVQAFLRALTTPDIEGETFMIAMNDPFDYVETAAYVGERLGIDVIELVDPVGQDFCIDVTKAKYVLGYRPEVDIFRLVDRAIEFRRSGRPRRQRSGYVG